MIRLFWDYKDIPSSIVDIDSSITHGEMCIKPYGKKASHFLPEHNLHFTYMRNSEIQIDVMFLSGMAFFSQKWLLVGNIYIECNCSTYLLRTYQYIFIWKWDIYVLDTSFYRRLHVSFLNLITLMAFCFFQYTRKYFM